MAMKMIQGDPVQTAAFKARTNVDLIKSDKKVLILCSTPESIESDFPALDSNIPERVNRLLKRQGIQLVDRRKVTRWFNEIGGEWDDIQEVAQEFDADYIILYEVNSASIRESGSKNMFRGRYAGGRNGF